MTDMQPAMDEAAEPSEVDVSEGPAAVRPDHGGATERSVPEVADSDLPSDTSHELHGGGVVDDMDVAMPADTDEADGNAAIIDGSDVELSVEPSVEGDQPDPTDARTTEGAGVDGDDRVQPAASEQNEDAGSRAESFDVSRLEREGDIAADYLEELLDIADLDGDLDMDVESDRAMVSVVGADLAQLVGRDGAVLEALQELTRLAVYRETGERSRLMLDISGYRAQRREELVAEAKSHIAEAKQSGEPVSLSPMSAFERKVVHDTVAASGLVSESEGTEPRRYVVIVPT